MLKIGLPAQRTLYMWVALGAFYIPSSHQWLAGTSVQVSPSMYTTHPYYIHHLLLSSTYYEMVEEGTYTPMYTFVALYSHYNYKHYLLRHNKHGHAPLSKRIKVRQLVSRRPPAHHQRVCERGLLLLPSTGNALAARTGQRHRLALVRRQPRQRGRPCS